MTLSINPGSGRVNGATSEHARANLGHFIADLTNAGHHASYVASGPSDDGRWLYVIRVNKHLHEVEMPGLPLDQVRFMAEDGQDPWVYPRLYVDGSSWLWKYGLSNAARDPEDEDVPRLDAADDHDVLSEAAARLRRASGDPANKLAAVLTTVAADEAGPDVLDRVVAQAEARLALSATKSSPLSPTPRHP